MTWDLQNEIEPPADSRPLTADQLLPDQVQTLRAAQQALWNIVQQNQRALESPDIQGRAPFARPDADRSPRVLLIDGGRGTGKSSLMLTLLDRLSAHRPTASRSAKERMKRDNDAFKQDNGAFKPDEHSAKRAADRERAVYHPDVAAHVLCMPPLDFDPMPPCVPIVAWLLESLRGLVDLVHADQREGCISLDSLSQAARQRGDLRRDWAELIDAAVAAWENGPDSGQTFAERTDADRRRLETLTGFNAKLNSVLDKLFGALETSKEARIGKGGVVLIAIDDADMQVRRSPELLHALRLVYHPRLVFILTANWNLMEEALDAYYAGQLLRLASTSDMAMLDAWTKRVGLAANLNPRNDISQQLLTKTIPSMHRFRQPELGVKEILSLVTKSFPIGSEVYAQILAKTSEHAIQWKTSYRLCLQEIQALSTVLARPTEVDHDASQGGAAWSTALLLTKLGTFAPWQLDLRRPPGPAELLRSVVAPPGGGFAFAPQTSLVVDSPVAAVRVVTSYRVIETPSGNEVENHKVAWFQVLAELTPPDVTERVLAEATKIPESGRGIVGPVVTHKRAGATYPWPELSPPNGQVAIAVERAFDVGHPAESELSRELRLVYHWLSLNTEGRESSFGDSEVSIQAQTSAAIERLRDDDKPHLVALMHPMFGLSAGARQFLWETVRRRTDWDSAITEGAKVALRLLKTLPNDAFAYVFPNDRPRTLHEPWLSVHLRTHHGTGGWAAARFDAPGMGLGTAILKGHLMLGRSDQSIGLATYFTNGPTNGSFYDNPVAWPMPEVAVAIEELAAGLGDEAQTSFWAPFNDSTQLPESRRFEVFFQHLMRYAWTAAGRMPVVSATTDGSKVVYKGDCWGIELTWAADTPVGGAHHRWRVRDAGGRYLQFADPVHERVAAAMLGIAADISSSDDRPTVLPVQREHNTDGTYPLGCPDFRTYAHLERCRCAASRLAPSPAQAEAGLASTAELMVAIQWVSTVTAIAKMRHNNFFDGHPPAGNDIATLISQTNELWRHGREADEQVEAVYFWMLEVQRRYGPALHAPAAREWATKFGSPLNATPQRGFPLGSKPALQIARMQAARNLQEGKPTDAAATLASAIAAGWPNLPAYDEVLTAASHELADLYSLMAFDGEAASYYATVLDVSALRENAAIGHIQTHIIRSPTPAKRLSDLAADAPEVMRILDSLRRAGARLGSSRPSPTPTGDADRHAILHGFFSCLAAVLRARPLLGLEWAEVEVIKSAIHAQQSSARLAARDAYSTFVAAYIGALIDTGSTTEDLFAHYLVEASADETLNPAMSADILAGEALEFIALSRLHSQRGMQDEAKRCTTHAMARCGIGEGEPQLPVHSPSTSLWSNVGDLRRLIASHRRWLAACGIRYTQITQQRAPPTDGGNDVVHLRSLRQVVAGAGIPAHPLLIAISLSALTGLNGQFERPTGTSVEYDIQELYDTQLLGSSTSARGEGHPASILAMEMWLRVVELRLNRDKGSDCTASQLDCTVKHLGPTSEYTLRAAQSSFAPYLDMADSADTRNDSLLQTLSALGSDVVNRRVKRLRDSATRHLDFAAKEATQRPLFRNAQDVVDWWVQSREINASEGQIAEHIVPTEHGMEATLVAPDTQTPDDTTGPPNPNTEPPTEE